MNIPLILTPKSRVSTVLDDDNIRMALEKMRHHGYSALPVIDKNNKYLGTLSEGDLLWYLYGECLEGYSIDLRGTQNVSVRDILNTTKYKPVPITAPLHELFELAKNQNFIPVVDDRGYLSGIVTRRDILKALTPKKEEEKQ